MALRVAFDGFVEYTKRLSSTCLITFEHNCYSVPASFANRVVSLHVYAERLVIVAEANKEPVLNCLSRLNDTPRPKPVNPPPPLRLVTEPVADSRRYDRLREGKR